MLKILSEKPRQIGYGFIHHFFSSIGQTFLISLFVPYFINDLNITNESWGYIYSAATLTSALTIPFMSKYIDKVRIRYISVINGILICFFCLVGSQINNIALLLFVIFGLRFTGQGMMILISSTTIGRYFLENRGKALSLSSFGLSFG
ncbi:MAG: MFS transporter, partial [Flavobacteriales bacterium]